MLRLVTDLLSIGALPLAVLLAGCFAPQEIELFEDPTVFNQPPVIDIRTASPIRPTCISGVVEEGLEQPTLRAQVSDPNGSVGQRLEARWFVDYEPGVSETTIAVRVQSLLPLQLGNDFSYPPLELGPEVIRRLRPISGTHQVEVVVSDGFDDGAEPRNRAPMAGDCGELEGPCHATTHKWTIEYLESAPCPN